MDKNDALSLARQYALLIKTTFDYKQIFLFGSYTKETYHDESDIDIAVILKEFENSTDIQLELMILFHLIMLQKLSVELQQEQMNILHLIKKKQQNMVLKKKIYCHVSQNRKM